jgi:hypothetical protein
MDDFNKRLKNKIYYLENRKSLIKKQIIYNNQNKEHIKEYQEKYRNGNLEYIRKINRDNMRTKDKTELMLKRYKNIANKLGLQCDIDLLMWNYIMGYFNNSCCFCDCNDDLGLTFITPYSKGGDIIFNNVVPCCKFHSKSKKNRIISEWGQYKVIEKYHPDKISRLNEYMKSNYNDI